MGKCDCLNYCGDDPFLIRRKVQPCDAIIREAHAMALRENMLRDFKPVLAARLTKKQQATLCALYPELAA
jgi:hypothetical protein